MTDQIVPCPVCHAVVVNTPTERREHRTWHTQEDKVREAVRKVATAADQSARTTAGSIRELASQIDQIEFDLRATPDDELALVAEWPEDEIDDQPASTYTDDDWDDDPDEETEPAPTAATTVETVNGTTWARP